MVYENDETEPAEGDSQPDNQPPEEEPQFEDENIPELRNGTEEIENEVARPEVDEALMSFVMNQPASNRERFLREVTAHLGSQRLEDCARTPFRKSRAKSRDSRKRRKPRSRLDPSSRPRKPRRDPIRRPGRIKKKSQEDRPGPSRENRPGTSREVQESMDVSEDDCDQNCDCNEKTDRREGATKRKMPTSGDIDSACGSCGGKSKKKRSRSKSCSSSRKKKSKSRSSSRSCSSSRKKKNKSRSSSRSCSCSRCAGSKRSRKSRSRSGSKKKCKGSCTIL